MNKAWFTRIGLALIVFFGRASGLAGQCAQTIEAGETTATLVGSKPGTAIAAFPSGGSLTFWTLTWTEGVYLTDDGRRVDIDCGDYDVQPL